MAVHSGCRAGQPAERQAGKLIRVTIGNYQGGSSTPNTPPYFLRMLQI